MQSIVYISTTSPLKYENRAPPRVLKPQGLKCLELPELLFLPAEGIVLGFRHSIVLRSAFPNSSHALAPRPCQSWVFSRWKGDVEARQPISDHRPRRNRTGVVHAFQNCCRSILQFHRHRRFKPLRPYSKSKVKFVTRVQASKLPTASKLTST